MKGSAVRVRASASSIYRYFLLRDELFIESLRVYLRPTK